MSIISELTDLSSDTFVRVCVFFLAFISPGLLSIYSLNAKLFVELDTLKLLLLAVSVTSPTFMLLFATTVVAERVLTRMKFLPSGKLGGFKDWYITNGLANAQIFHVAALLSFLFDLSSRAFIFWILGLFISFLVLEFFRVLKFARSESFDAQITDPGARR